MSQNPYDPPDSPFAPPSPPGEAKAPGAGLPLGLGIFGLIAWLLPIVGLPVTVWGLVRGVKALRGPNQAMAVVAIVLCGIGLTLCLANVALAVYIALTGQGGVVGQMKEQ